MAKRVCVFLDSHLTWGYYISFKSSKLLKIKVNVGGHYKRRNLLPYLFCNLLTSSGQISKTSNYSIVVG